jgi:hypothetical protein
LAALEIADNAPPQIDRADAAGWVAAQIMQRPAGQATVLSMAKRLKMCAPMRLWSGLKWMAANWAQ